MRKKINTILCLGMITTLIALAVTVNVGADDSEEINNDPISATIDINPGTLNLKSNGQWVTAYIELPGGYDVNDIDVSTIGISAETEQVVPVDLEAPVTVGDHDNDGISDLMVKFPRPPLLGLLGGSALIDYNEDSGNKHEVTLKITGNLIDQTTFEGTDTVSVIG